MKVSIFTTLLHFCFTVLRVDNFIHRCLLPLARKHRSRQVCLLNYKSCAALFCWIWKNNLVQLCPNKNGDSKLFSDIRGSKILLPWRCQSLLSFFISVLPFSEVTIFMHRCLLPLARKHRSRQVCTLNYKSCEVISFIKSADLTSQTIPNGHLTNLNPSSI